MLSLSHRPEKGSRGGLRDTRAEKLVNLDENEVGYQQLATGTRRRLCGEAPPIRRVDEWPVSARALSVPRKARGDTPPPERRDRQDRPRTDLGRPARPCESSRSFLEQTSNGGRKRLALTGQLPRSPVKGIRQADDSSNHFTTSLKRYEPLHQMIASAASSAPLAGRNRPRAVIHSLRAVP